MISSQCEDMWQAYADESTTPLTDKMLEITLSNKTSL